MFNKGDYHNLISVFGQNILLYNHSELLDINKLVIIYSFLEH
jgi:hypothetical protein